jgi:predicted GNAT superfamily acetyltransferase
MRWTFDPLLASHASFNLNKLGAKVRLFIPECYGARRDRFNDGDVTDRLEVEWSLLDPVGPEPLATGSRSIIEIPPNYHAIFASNAVQAREHRARVGAALLDTYAAGHSVLGYTNAGYVLDDDLGRRL